MPRYPHNEYFRKYEEKKEAYSNNHKKIIQRAQREIVRYHNHNINSYNE